MKQAPHIRWVLFWVSSDLFSEIVLVPHDSLWRFTRPSSTVWCVRTQDSPRVEPEDAGLPPPLARCEDGSWLVCSVPLSLSSPSPQFHLNSPLNPLSRCQARFLISCLFALSRVNWRASTDVCLAVPHVVVSGRARSRPAVSAPASGRPSVPQETAPRRSQALPAARTRLRGWPALSGAGSPHPRVRGRVLRALTHAGLGVEPRPRCCYSPLILFPGWKRTVWALSSTLSQGPSRFRETWR